MSALSLSLWLPIGRANFYSGTAKGWLESPASSSSAHDNVMHNVVHNVMRCSSRMLREPGYIPHLQASVLRRLLEVLPSSLGYDPVGVSALSEELDGLSRPVDVTMTLTPPRHGTLARAGVTRVLLHVDEHGFYTFTAELVDAADRRPALLALREHAGDVFGGAFNVDRLREHRTKGYSEGAAAVRRYNGLADADASVIERPPVGALSFFQLNTLVEGLFNDTLSPAVFFEQFHFMHNWARGRGSATTPLLTMSDVVRVLAIEADARTGDGKVIALHQFLAVTARESLQKLKWSVESVRRSLLDEMMGVLHRQSRLIQLDLGASPQERTPELAIGATESQLRGYVMLISAKLPLVVNVHELARLTSVHIGQLVGDTDQERRAVDDLAVLLENWHALLLALERNVHSLESAIEQAWMEKLLYEQEQSRSNQEAMGEIERSRRGRPSSGRVGERAYNSLMLIFTILAVVITIQATDVNRADATWWERIIALWPILAIFAVVFLLEWFISAVRRMIRERRGASETYTYEFAFRIDERTDPKRVHDFLNGRRRERLPTRMFRRTLLVFPRRKLLITRRGGGRIERVSSDTTLVKFHSVVTFRVSGLRYARFEVVNEVLARKVSDAPRYLLRQTRVFGESPSPLRPDQVLELVRGILRYVGVPLAADGNLSDLVSLVEPFYSRDKLDEALRLYASEWAADETGSLPAIR
jgi:hypothetical protein